MAGARRMLAMAAFAAVGFCAIPASAGAAIYWVSGGAVNAANLDGTGVQEKYFWPRGPLQPVRSGVAVTDSHLYWYGGNGIYGMSLLGRDEVQTLAGPPLRESGMNRPGGLALGGEYLYWGDFHRNTIGRLRLDGSGGDTFFIDGLDGPCGVAVDSHHVYWADNRGVGRANLDGSEPESAFIPEAGPCGVAVGGGHVYWGDDQAGAIGRANLDGGDVERQFLPGVGSPAGIAANATHLFWTDQPFGAFSGSIGRANLDGSGVDRNWIPDKFHELTALAVDSRPTPPPLFLTSTPVKFGQVRHDRRRGTAVIDIWFPRPGELSVVSPKVGWKVLDEATLRKTGVRRVRLKVWAGKSGRTAKRIRRQLWRKGRAPLSLKISYREEGNFLPTFATRKLALLRTVSIHRKRNAGHRRPGSRRSR